MRTSYIVYLALTAALLAPGPPQALAQDGISAARRTAVVRAVERVQPAVVSVHVTYRQRVLVQRYRRDPFFDLFSPFMVPGEREHMSAGSGFIVDEEGHILTNAHVVGDPERLRKISVALTDGRTLEAQHVASDNSFDLAVLKVNDADMPVAPLGDSSDILVGEWSIAIGNPFDLGPTASIGIVSALDRDFSEQQGDYYYRDMIQTDAAINQGNSGGPLVNALGEVIGVNSFIYTPGDYSIGSIGIGFALPINAARSFLEEVRQHGEARHAWTGIQYLQDLTALLQEHLSLPSTDGALVVQVAPRSPADQAGLERGDVITAINGEQVRSVDEAISIVKRFRVDDDCALRVIRFGETLELRMRLIEMDRSRRRW
jgi:serine protease Do